MEKKLTLAAIEKKLKTAEIISWIVVVLLCIVYGILSGFLIKMNVWLSICVGFAVGIVIGILRVIVTDKVRLKILNKYLLAKNTESNQ